MRRGGLADPREPTGDRRGRLPPAAGALASRGGPASGRGGAPARWRRHRRAGAPARAGQDDRARTGREALRSRSAVPRDRTVGRRRHVRRVRRRSGRGRGHRRRHHPRPRRDRGRQRRHGEGRRLVPDDLQEGPARAGDRDGEPAAGRVSGRFSRRLPAAAGRDLPGPRPLRARLLQQRAAVGRRHLPGGRDHGLVRRRRRLPADHERRVATSWRAPARSSWPGPHLVKAAIGEAIENEELGGAVVQCDISGVVDHRHPDEATCLAQDPRSVRAARSCPHRRRSPAARRATRCFRRPSSTA